MKTIVTAPLRITIESHRALTEKAHSEGFRRYGQLIRKILHEWALKQKQPKKD